MKPQLATVLSFVALALVVAGVNYFHITFSRQVTPACKYVAVYSPTSYQHSGHRIEEHSANKVKRLWHLRKEIRSVQVDRIVGWPFAYWTPVAVNVQCSNPAVEEKKATRYNYGEIDRSRLVLNFGITNFLLFAIWILWRKLNRLSPRDVEQSRNRSNFSLRTLLVLVGVFAIGFSLYGWTTALFERCTIFHSSFDGVIEFPSAETYVVNHWYQRNTRFENIIFAEEYPEKQNFLVEKESEYFWGNPLVPIATIEIGGKRFEAILQNSIHYDAGTGLGCHEYWIIPGKMLDPKAKAVK